MYNYSRIAIIKENGDIDIIFSCKDNEINHLLNFSKEDDVKKIYEYEESIKDNIYYHPQIKESHLLYIKQYLKSHFVDEFKKMNIDPQIFSMDIYLYYFLTQINNVVLINSGAHHNLLIAPNEGLNDEQVKSIDKICEIFKDDTWSISENMHFVDIEDHGQKYKYLEPGEQFKNNLKDYLDVYKQKEGKIL